MFPKKLYILICTLTIRSTKHSRTIRQHVHRDKKQSKDTNTNDEMTEAHSFTADGGDFECSAIDSVWPVFVCFCMENDENTSSESLVGIANIVSVGMIWNSFIDDETMKQSNVTRSARIRGIVIVILYMNLYWFILFNVKFLFFMQTLMNLNSSSSIHNNKRF